MKISKQEVVIHHSAKKLYQIVLDIEKYPEFIPWCSAVKIRARKINSIKAELFVKYKVFQKTFTSNVVYDSNKLIIDVFYLEGPLKNLQTQWKFEKIEEKKTKVYFNIKFEFKNKFYQKMINIFFDLIENKFINSFKERADKILN